MERAIDGALGSAMREGGAHRLVRVARAAACAQASVRPRAQCVARERFPDHANLQLEDISCIA